MGSSAWWYFAKQLRKHESHRKMSAENEASRYGCLKYGSFGPPRTAAFARASALPYILAASAGSAGAPAPQPRPGHATAAAPLTAAWRRSRRGTARVIFPPAGR